MNASNLVDAKKQGAVLAWGNFLTLCINFAIVALALFLVVRAMNTLKRTEPPPPAAAKVTAGAAVADRNPGFAEAAPKLTGSMADKNERKIKVVAETRKARFNYAIDEFHRGWCCVDRTEVKSIRTGKATIAEAYANSRDGEIGSSTPTFRNICKLTASIMRRSGPRKLLLHRRQLNKLIGAVEREGMTLVPLKLYFNEQGRAKIELALAKGKKLHDKRETERKRDWNRKRAGCSEREA